MVTTVVVQTPNDGLTMSSREIAELVESRHDNVKRAIERLADRGVIGLPPMEEYLDSLNRPALEYRLVKRDSYIIVAQLSPEFTARLVDRWQELESQLSNAPALPNFEDAIQAAQAWIEAKKAHSITAEKLVKVEQKVLQDAPKVAFHDAVVETEGTYRLDAVAKLIGTGIIRLKGWLKAEGFLRKDNGRPMQRYVDSGHFEVRLRKGVTPEGIPYEPLVLVTGRGLAAIHRKLHSSVHINILKINSIPLRLAA